MSSAVSKYRRVALSLIEVTPLCGGGCVVRGQNQQNVLIVSTKIDIATGCGHPRLTLIPQNAKSRKSTIFSRSRGSTDVFGIKVEGSENSTPRTRRDQALRVSTVGEYIYI